MLSKCLFPPEWLFILFDFCAGLSLLVFRIQCEVHGVSVCVSLCVCVCVSCFICLHHHSNYVHHKNRFYRFPYNGCAVTNANTDGMENGGDSSRAIYGDVNERATHESKCEKDHAIKMLTDPVNDNRVG